jgi:hypothetical protein
MIRYSIFGIAFYKSLILTGEDFFLFCDPPVTPAFAFLLTDAAAAFGGIGSDAVTVGGDLVSIAARLAAGSNSGPDTGSPAHFTSAAAVSAAAAVASPTESFLSFTLGPTTGFETQHSFEAATGPLASTGRSPLAGIGSAADAAAVAAAGSIAAGTPVSTPAAGFLAAASPKASTDSASLTNLTVVAASAAGAAAVARAAGTDSFFSTGSTADASGCTPSGSTAGSAGGNSVTTSSTTVGSTAAGSTAAAESSDGAGGSLPLDPAHMPDGPGTASSSPALSPSTWLPPSRAGAAGLAARCRLEAVFFLPPFPLGSSMSFPAKVKNLLPFWTVALCHEGLFLLPYNELAVAQGPKIYQKNEL